MKTFITNFSNIGNQFGLRFGVFYRHFFDIEKAKVWDSSVSQLSNFISKISSEKLKKGELDEQELLIDLANIERRFDTLIDIEKVTEIGSDKNIIQEGDIIIPKIQPRMGNIFTNLSHKRYLGSSELIEYKCISNEIHPKILFYILTHPHFQRCLSACEGGKTHRRVNPIDLLLYKIPKISLAKQQQILPQILNIESEIKKNKDSLMPLEILVDEVFQKYIGIRSESILEDYKKTYFFNLSDLNSSDIRTSVRYNNPKYEFLASKKFEYTFADIIDSSKTSLGRQMSPNFIEEESDVYYINTNAIKLSGFDESVLTPISSNFYSTYSNLKVEINDILLIASGEGSIGRTCIFDSDLDCITSQFVMKLHPKKGVDLKFLNYYMHSFYFQYCVEKFKKGKGNMTNIFVNQLLKFPLFYPNERIRFDIVKEITEEITKQDIINKRINKLRYDIDKMIEFAICHSNENHKING